MNLQLYKASKISVEKSKIENQDKLPNPPIPPAGRPPPTSTRGIYLIFLNIHCKAKHLPFICNMNLKPVPGTEMIILLLLLLNIVYSNKLGAIIMVYKTMQIYIYSKK